SAPSRSRRADDSLPPDCQERLRPDALCRVFPQSYAVFRTNRSHPRDGAFAVTTSRGFRSRPIANPDRTSRLLFEMRVETYVVRRLYHLVAPPAFLHRVRSPPRAAVDSEELPIVRRAAETRRRLDSPRLSTLPNRGTSAAAPRVLASEPPPACPMRQLLYADQPQ